MTPTGYVIGAAVVLALVGLASWWHCGPNRFPLFVYLIGVAVAWAVVLGIAWLPLAVGTLLIDAVPASNSRQHTKKAERHFNWQAIVERMKPELVAASEAAHKAKDADVEDDSDDRTMELVV